MCIFALSITIKNKIMEKEVLKLIDFLLYLNEKKIINNYDFDYLKEAELYLKQLK